ncbi:hypothetical protein Tco_0905411 [Tanacetum coccineum]
MDHFGSTKEVDHVRILQSYNGLLLCIGSAWPVFYYVYNSFNNLLKRIPQPNYSHDDSGFYSSGVLRMAFDPRKSLYYKVVKAGRTSGETHNDAFHWLKGLNRQLKHCKLNIEDRDHPIMTTLDIPYGLHRGRNFLESFGGSCDDPILLLIKIPHMYLVNTKELMNPLSEGWSIQTSVWSICLGEGENDAFLVINLSGKVVKYNLISKTINEIFDIGSNQMNDDDDEVEFIPPFEVDPNLYEFISSLASV